VGVFGANSAGKSTLMYTLSGIMEDIKKKEEMAGGETNHRFQERSQSSRNRHHRTKAEREGEKGAHPVSRKTPDISESSVLENLKIGGYLATPAQAKETLDYVFKLFPALLKLKKRVEGS